MQKKITILVILVVAVAFCFALVSEGQAGPNDPLTQAQAKNNLRNAKKVTPIPIWQITQDGTASSVDWQAHGPNPRFAIYDVEGDNAGGSAFYSDDIVLDKETRRVWARDANLASLSAPTDWEFALKRCRWLTLAHRQGWRVPTVEELSSLADSRNSPRLPSGHPFINVQDAGYWTSTTDELTSDNVWIVHTHLGLVGGYPKDPPTTLLYIWPVRGGNGYASGNW